MAVSTSRPERFTCEPIRSRFSISVFWIIFSIFTFFIKNKKNKSGDKYVDTNILKTQERIEKILGLKVNILNKKNNSGKITIEYKDLDQFELVSDLLTKH